MSIQPEPKVGDIWSARQFDRRVRVVRVRDSGRVALEPVTRVGAEWKRAPRKFSSTCDGEHFVKAYRLLEAAQKFPSSTTHNQESVS